MHNRGALFRECHQRAARSSFPHKGLRPVQPRKLGLWVESREPPRMRSLRSSGGGAAGGAQPTAPARPQFDSASNMARGPGVSPPINSLQLEVCSGWRALSRRRHLTYRPLQFWVLVVPQHE